MVVLVDEFDREVGAAEKLRAHREGLLHRAFSLFVVNGDGELLLQRRAFSKYHSPGLWSNTCCSHPRPDESIKSAARRRLPEEMGISVEPESAFSFVYHATFDNGLIEHELDHVLIGQSNEDPSPHVEEVAEWRWASAAQIRSELVANPEHFTVWFRLCFERAVAIALAESRA